ncbi:hypothetical protein BO83DRAFT_120276 [Aspergillus eucalypticola CBS 122712]|uniref:Zn(2)-C6 fungal-type domain-containing protein n=1 Tax=Aspergillus eucalypticola (strain CBS 122712 / IBT 29274) TaxID=1448314 RepID=A0A317UV39_ASPEC|nr:uncharacterized protein BO83DRAFT_120276 [Aspergillus eucalypticola CBS 122712]PWY65485.1 hypothetical protein BO83DRAFT_120276 [Aspergillus eucalypticola CBS 122712]
MSELSAANDSVAFPQAPLPSSSQLFSSRNFRKTPSEEIMSVVTPGSEPLHKACDTCRARKTRCSESRFQSVGRELLPGRCLTNLDFTPEISGNTDACDFCLVYQAAMSPPFGMLIVPLFIVHSRSTVPAPLLQSSDQGSANMMHQFSYHCPPHTNSPFVTFLVRS